MNVIALQKVRSVSWTLVTQKRVNAIANHQFVAEFVTNARTVHSIWSVAIYSVAKIVDVILVGQCMVIVIKEPANVNAIHVLLGARVPKRLQRIIIRLYIKINLNLRTVTHHLVHMFGTNSMKHNSQALANEDMPNLRNCKVNSTTKSTSFDRPFIELSFVM